MQHSNHFFILPLIFAIIGTPLAFADVELTGVNIFCPLEERLGFTAIVPILEICPINVTPPPPIQPQVSINDIQGPEGAAGDLSSFIFTVSLSSETSLLVSVDFSTSDNTATTADDDYIATSGTIDFAPGETSKTIAVNIIGDNIPETTETFDVILSNCVNCNISDGIGVGTIPAGNEAFSLQDKQVFQDWSDSWSTANQVLLFTLPDSALTFATTGPLCVGGLLAIPIPPLNLIPCIPIAVEAAIILIPPGIEIITQQLADDPPDNNFQTIFLLPSFQTFDVEGDAEIQIELVKLVNAISKEEALLQAFLTSYERYQGAAIANEEEFLILQLSAVKTYSDLLVENQIELKDALLGYRQTIQNDLLIQNLEPVQNRLQSEGFTDDEIESFLDNGYSLDRINEIKEGLLVLDETNVLVLTELLEQLADSIDPVTETFQTFSTELDEVLPSLRDQKEDIKLQLESKIEDAQFKNTKKKIEKAVEQIEDSLDEELWVDDRHLDEDDGKEAFQEEKKAVKKLMNIIKDEKEDQAFLDMIQDVIDRIVDVDRSLATIALIDAQEFAGDKKADKQIEKANAQIEKAEEDLDEGKFDKAIEHYKKAWKHAQKAMNDEDDDDEDEDDEDDDEEEDDDEDDD